MVKDMPSAHGLDGDDVHDEADDGAGDATVQANRFGVMQNKTAGTLVQK